MNTGIAHIFLAWRKRSGSRRILVGIIKRNATSGVRFEYLQDGVEQAKKDGFIPYPDFPDVTKTYTENVLEVFGQRLNKSEREDIKKYYSYWEIDTALKDDKFYLLAHTQALLPTDNFEFLADYNPVKGLSFVSELCSLTKLQLPPDFIQEGEELTWEKEPQNSYDKFAVKVFKGDKFVGYVKKVHSKVFFRKNADKLKITVKSLNKNGHINRAFIKVSF